MKYILIILFATIIISSCERLAIDPNPETDNLSIFDEYTKLVKEKYAMLEFKGVDIVSLSDSIRSTITNKEDKKALFDKLSIITYRLRDGHSSLSASETDAALNASYNILEGYSDGLNISISKYLKDLKRIPEVVGEGEIPYVIYGNALGHSDIGYMWIPSFDVPLEDKDLETIFSSFKDTKGLIFDVRLNGGGDPSLSSKIASYFTDKAVAIGYERFKVGPDLNDFADSHITLQPASSDNKYLKPVVVLTDRNVYSATTTLAYSMDPMENVTFMGQRTGGGSGSVADGFLANGWKWSLSTSEFIDIKGRHLDDGVDPDISVALDTMNNDIDEVIERAILELN